MDEITEESTAYFVNSDTWQAGWHIWGHGDWSPSRFSRYIVMLKPFFNPEGEGRLRPPKRLVPTKI